MCLSTIYLYLYRQFLGVLPSANVPQYFSARILLTGGARTSQEARRLVGAGRVRVRWLENSSRTASRDFSNSPATPDIRIYTRIIINL